MTAAVEQLEPPAGIMPVEGEGQTLVPSNSVIERLRAMANDVAESGLGVGGCRTPGAVFFKFMLGWEHGLRPMTALSAIDIIEGKACLNAAALAATVEARGLGSITVRKADDDGCTVVVKRADLPGTVDVEYTLQDASAAGFLAIGPDGKLAKNPNGSAISKKKNWSTNYLDMYFARATGRAYRRWFRVASLGLGYTREELEDGEAGGNERPLAVELEKPKPNWIVPGANGAAQPEGKAEVAPGIAALIDQPVKGPIPNQTYPELAKPTGSVVTGDATETAIKTMYRTLGITKEVWAQIMKRMGVEKLSDLPMEKRIEVLDLLKYTEWTRRLRAVVNFPDAKFTAALAKRGVTTDLELSLAAAKEIYAKLAELKTPFELKELNIGPDTGVTLGNEPSPPAVVTPVASEIPALPPMPPG